MAGKLSKSKLSVVVSELDNSFVVSVSEVSSKGETTVLGEEEIETLTEVEIYLGEMARRHNYAPERIERLYNLASGITSKPPHAH